MAKHIFRKLNLFILFLVIFLNACFISPVVPARDVPTTSAQNENITKEPLDEPSTFIYLPIVLKTGNTFFGIYLKEYWTKDSVQQHMSIADQAAGKKHTSVGWFIDLEDDAFTIPVTTMGNNNLYRQLDELWKAGYVSFINLGSSATAQQIINGERDSEIGYAAEFYKQWISLGGGRKAMIAPLQEMNGDWTSYGKYSSSAEYKQAYRRIFNIFSQKGISRADIWWVFAPNGWNDPTQPSRQFENYYPGDDVVDVIGFSSYNYGWCPSTSSISGKWESYSEIFEPYISRMEVMAPSKPIIIAETATTAYYAENKYDTAHKNQWLIENYNYLANHPSVVGVYYFSFSEFDGYACDFELFENNTVFSGYKDGLKSFDYRYFTANELGSLLR